MSRLLPLLLVGFSLVVTADVGSPVTAGVSAKEPRPAVAAFPIGKWNVAFTNGVNEVCDIFEFDGVHITVDEPARRARGMVAVRDGSFVMTFYDDRIERWTAVGDRYVVEHFFPGAAFPEGTPVLGIGERAR